MVKKILITGGAGFIGSYVCEAFLARGYHVRALDNLEPQVHGEGQHWPSYLHADVERFYGDVGDRAALETALDGCEAVIHLAGLVGVGQSMYQIERYTRANVLGTAILLEEIIKRRDKIRKLMVASSISIYGEGAYRRPDGQIAFPTPRTVEQLRAGMWEIEEEGTPLTPIPTPEMKPLRPESVYAVNKRDQEEMCLSIGRAYNIPTIALRMFNVYGARQALSNPYTGVVAIFCARLLNGLPPLIFEDGRQRRDFVHVEDVANAYVAALEHDGADGLALNLGSGQHITIEDAALKLAQLLNLDIEPEVTGAYREGDIRHCFADVSLMREKLPTWQPRWSFEAGASTLLDWLQNQQGNDRVSHMMDELRERGLLK